MAFGKLGIPNLCPSTIENSWWSHEFAELVYFLESGIPSLDICGFIIFQMISMTSPAKTLGYPCLISQICRDCGFDSIGNSLGVPKPVRPCTFKRIREIACKRQRIASLDFSDPTTVSLLQKIHKGVCKVNSRVKCVQEQLSLFATKFPKLKEDLNAIQASPMRKKMSNSCSFCCLVCLLFGLIGRITSARIAMILTTHSYYFSSSCIIF